MRPIDWIDEDITPPNRNEGALLSCHSNTWHWDRVSIAFLFVLTFWGCFGQTQNADAATPVQSGSKISWLGKNWNVTGVNMPWNNWGCDFGCNSSGGVVQTKSTIATRFATIQGAGLHTVRWWVFPGVDPWQITVDGSGKPIGINPAVYADFDAALQLADQFNLYYNFVLFSAATHPTRSWIDNPTHRTALAQVLGSLFARYKNNPRVMSWEIFNEPEFQIWNGEISEANTVATAKLIADSVHLNSDALVTIGNAYADGIPMWSTVNLDYYSPHWYDYMSGSGDWCMDCHDYNFYRTKYAITKPMVAGEIYLGSDINPLNRSNSFYTKGYAGVWGWSLFPERTSDGLLVDLTALRSFSSSHSDIGPVLQAGGPPMAPTNLRITAMLLGPIREVLSNLAARAGLVGESRQGQLRPPRFDAFGLLAEQPLAEHVDLMTECYWCPSVVGIGAPQPQHSFQTAANVFS